MFELSILLMIIIFMFGGFLKGWSGFGTNLVVPPLLLFMSRFDDLKVMRAKRTLSLIYFAQHKTAEALSLMTSSGRSNKDERSVMSVFGQNIVTRTCNNGILQKLYNTSLASQL